MFSLMDRVPDGITPMLQDLEEHIISAGLADMHAAADFITTVSPAQRRRPPEGFREGKMVRGGCRQ